MYRESSMQDFPYILPWKIHQAMAVVRPFAILRKRNWWKKFQKRCKAPFRYVLSSVNLTASERVNIKPHRALWSLFRKHCNNNPTRSDQVIFLDNTAQAWTAWQNQRASSCCRNLSFECIKYLQQHKQRELCGSSFGRAEKNFNNYL